MALKDPAQQRWQGNDSERLQRFLLSVASHELNKGELGLGKFTAAGTENKYQVLEGRIYQVEKCSVFSSELRIY